MLENEFAKFVERIKSPIPIKTTKKELYILMSTKAGWEIDGIRKKAIESIMETRNVPYKEACNSKFLFPNELNAFLKKFEGEQ